MFSEAISRFSRPRWMQFAAAGDRLFWLAYLILLPIYLIPICVTRFLPGLDLPFHLALVDMLHKVDLPSSPYRAIFDGTLRVSPYMGYLFVLWLLSFVFSVGLSHKLLFALYVAMLPLSMERLLVRCGRNRIPALLGFPLCYNMAVHYGFMSFALSLPLLLFLCAELARVSQEDPLRPARSLAWLGGLGVALFLFHLLNYAFFLCVALAAAVLSRITLRRRLLMLLGLGPSLLLFVYWRITSPDAGSATQPGRGLGDAVKLLWQSRHEIYLPGRIAALPDAMLKGFYDGTDRRAASLLLVLIFIYFVLGLQKRLSPEVRKSQAQPPLILVAPIALGGALLAYLTLPHHLREFDVMTLFPRFSVTLGALLVLAIPAALSRQSQRVLALCVLGAFTLDVYYGLELVRHYRMFARETADFAAVLDKTPPGGKAAGLVFDRQSRVLTNESILVGLPSYYPVERQAPTSLVDILYCDMKHMPCRTRNMALRPPVPQPWTPKELRAELAIPYFDYIFVRRGPTQEQLFGRFAGDLQVLAKAGTWVVYRKRDGYVRNGAVNAAPVSTKSSGSTSSK